MKKALVFIVNNLKFCNGYVSSIISLTALLAAVPAGLVADYSNIANISSIPSSSSSSRPSIPASSRPRSPARSRPSSSACSRPTYCSSSSKLFVVVLAAGSASSCNRATVAALLVADLLIVLATTVAHIYSISASSSSANCSSRQIGSSPLFYSSSVLTHFTIDS